MKKGPYSQYQFVTVFGFIVLSNDWRNFLTSTSLSSSGPRVVLDSSFSFLSISSRRTQSALSSRIRYCYDHSEESVVLKRKEWDMILLILLPKGFLVCGQRLLDCFFFGHRALRFFFHYRGLRFFFRSRLLASVAFIFYSVILEKVFI